MPPPLLRAEPPPAPEPAASPPRRPTLRTAHAEAAAYVKLRATEWWDKAKAPELAPMIRAEARAIAAELFDVAESLKRGGRPATDDDYADVADPDDP